MLAAQLERFERRVDAKLDTLDEHSRRIGERVAALAQASEDSEQAWAERWPKIERAIQSLTSDVRTHESRLAALEAMELHRFETELAKLRSDIDHAKGIARGARLIPLALSLLATVLAIFVALRSL